jgi:hypothetical protein
MWTLCLACSPCDGSVYHITHLCWPTASRSLQELPSNPVPTDKECNLCLESVFPAPPSSVSYWPPSTIHCTLKIEAPWSPKMMVSYHITTVSQTGRPWLKSSVPLETLKACTAHTILSPSKLLCSTCETT